MEAAVFAFESRLDVFVDHRLQAVRAFLDGSEDGARPDPEDPIAWLGERLGLTPTEEQILWLLVGHELCPEVRTRLRALATEEASEPTRELLYRLVYRNTSNRIAWRELGEAGALQRLGLVERTDTGPDAAYRHTLKASRRVLAVVHGERELDPSLAGIAQIIESEPSALEIDAGIVDRVRSLVRASDAIVVVHGGAGTGRRSLLVGLAEERGQKILTIDARTIASDPPAAERQLRTIARECALFGLTPLVTSLDALAASESAPDRLAACERELAGGLVLATSSRPIARRWQRQVTFVELPRPTGRQRSLLWSRAVPDADADVLAAMYPLSPALIAAAGAATARAGGDVDAGVRSVVDDRLAGLATRVTTSQTWDDLILPGDQFDALVELIARIRRRQCVYEQWGFGDKLGKGLGVAALLSGPPGTGKTMCAGLVARELGTALYQVHLDRLTSKWIGETEKNLAALFDAAEACHAILLFDEADSLFGKRTDVKSSNDRRANQEVNFLLQRLESFTGICILTTNHETALDDAFRRRLAVHVRFALPDVQERKHLWRALLPSSAPRARDVERSLDALAEQFELSGGHIRNAVLRAAFLAADEDSVITAAHLGRSAQLEYEAMGKLYV